MSSTFKTALAATVILVLSGCSPRPLIAQTETKAEAYPVSCLMECAPIPKPVGATEAELIRWELSVVHWGETCRARHNDCMEKLRERNETKNAARLD